ncbi:MAG: alpha-glycosidase [Chloroflexi bacterium]|nr:alpha-glycosidase [Chloroflexota bacterium]
MDSALSQAAAARLRPVGPLHMPPPAQPLNAVIELSLTGSTSQPEVHLVDSRRNLSWRALMTAAGDRTWHATIRLPAAPTIVTYHFEFADAPPLLEQRQYEGETTPHYGEWFTRPFQIAVYDPARMPADWTQGMVIYQIFPDRFANGEPGNDRLTHGVYGHPPIFKSWGELPEAPPLGRDFFGGDLRGVIAKLDYLVNLGVECLYFNPIFAAPTNHRYEAIDFMQIEPMLGDDAVFDQLIAEAHARGIRVILDAVFNHCSADSVYYQAAQSSRESPYYRWFSFTQWPHNAVGWAGFGFMPEFVECPEMEHYFNGPAGVTAHWLRRGIDGWRADVAPDNSDAFWRGFRLAAESVRPDAYLVAEHWVDSSHYLLGDTFSAAMNYRFTWAVRGFLVLGRLTPSEFDDRLMTWLRDTPPPARHAQMNLLSSHDTDRLLTLCGGDRRKFQQAMAFMLAYVGAPTIYYGDETGLEGSGPEDGRRTMPWDALDAELGAFFKAAIALRRGSPALRTGEVETVVIDDAERAYVFARRAAASVVYAAFNASDADTEIEIVLNEGTTDWRVVLGQAVISAADDQLTVMLPARGFPWLARP